MLLEKTQGPLSRLKRSLFVVAPPRIAIEAVSRLIPVDFHADYGTAVLQVHACLIRRCTGTSIFPFQDEADTARRWNS